MEALKQNLQKLRDEYDTRLWSLTAGLTGEKQALATKTPGTLEYHRQNELVIHSETRKYAITEFIARLDQLLAP